MQKEKKNITKMRATGVVVLLGVVAFSVVAGQGVFAGTTPENVTADMPIPDDVARLVTHTHVCEAWIKIENDATGERKDFMDHLVATTPILTWAQNNCSYEWIEAEAARLRTLYKDNPFVPYVLDNMLGTYKD